MWFEIDRENNELTITNITNSNIYYTLYYTSSCDLEENYEVFIVETTILSEESSTFSLPDQDGLYKLFLTDKGSLSQNIYFPQYKSILSSLVEDIDFVLCGCNCPSCSECDEEQDTLVSVLLKMLSYVLINKNKYEKTLLNSVNCIECNILDENLCYIIHESISGSYENKKLLKQIISYYYLVFYYTDLLLEKNETLIKLRYNYSKIYSCVKKQGLDIKCIEESAEENIYCPACDICEEEIDVDATLTAGISATQNTNGYFYSQVIAQQVGDEMRLVYKDRINRILSETFHPYNCGVLVISIGFSKSAEFPNLSFQIGFNADSQTYYRCSSNGILKGTDFDCEGYNNAYTGVVVLEISKLLDNTEEVVLGEVWYHVDGYPTGTPAGATNGGSIVVTAVNPIPKV